MRIAFTYSPFNQFLIPGAPTTCSCGSYTRRGRVEYFWGHGVYTKTSLGILSGDDGDGVVVVCDKVLSLLQFQLTQCPKEYNLQRL